MEGYIEQGNDLTVLLGENYFVKCTAAYARSILQRRVDCTFQIRLNPLTQQILTRFWLILESVTNDKLNGLNGEYDLIKSRVGLAKQWLEVDEHPEYEQDAKEEQLTELRLPQKQGPKPKIEIITSTNTEGSNQYLDSVERMLEIRRARIRELERMDEEMSEEELAAILGAPIPDFPGDQKLLPDETQANIVEILEHYKPDGTVETFLTPKGGKPTIHSKTKQVLTPMIMEHTAEKPQDVVTMVPSPSESGLSSSEPPKRVSKFKAMREANRQQ